MYFHKAQEKPLRWGNVNDIQYSIKRNMESIYLCDPDNEVLIMPLFWGLPCLDFSGKGNHGTNHGATYKDGSLDFDGGSGYVDCGEGLDEIESDSIFSINFWVQRKDDTFYQRIISHGKDGNEFFQIVISDDTLGAIGWEVGTPTLNETKGATSEADKLNKDTWYHIVFVCDSGSKLYINGVSKTLANTASKGNPCGNFLLGKDAGGSSYFNGLMDEVRISKAARTAETIGIFYERPWDLYRRVSRPVYFLPSAAAWTGKFTGVTNPAKINGVAVANISKVMGIS